MTRTTKWQRFAIQSICLTYLDNKQIKTHTELQSKPQLHREPREKIEPQTQKHEDKQGFTAMCHDGHPLLLKQQGSRERHWEYTTTATSLKAPSANGVWNWSFFQLPECSIISNPLCPSPLCSLTHINGRLNCV